MTATKTLPASAPSQTVSQEPHVISDRPNQIIRELNQKASAARQKLEQIVKEFHEFGDALANTKNKHLELRHMRDAIVSDIKHIDDNMAIPSNAMAQFKKLKSHRDILLQLTRPDKIRPDTALAALASDMRELERLQNKSPALVEIHEKMQSLHKLSDLYWQASSSIESLSKLINKEESEHKRQRRIYDKKHDELSQEIKTIEFQIKLYSSLIANQSSFVLARAFNNTPPSSVQNVSHTVAAYQAAIDNKSDNACAVKASKATEAKPNDPEKENKNPSLQMKS